MPKPHDNGVAVAAAPALPTQELAIESIFPSPDNPRKTFDQVKLEELAASIKSKGVLEPILVRAREVRRQVKISKEFSGTEVSRDGYELVAGERRWRAAQIAGLATIPARIGAWTDTEVREVRAIENEQREGTSPLEKADGYQQLIDKDGYTVERIAEKIGKSVSTIRGILNLARAPEVLRRALEAGLVPAATAELVCRVPGAQTRDDVARRVIEGHGYFEDDPPTTEHIEKILAGKVDWWEGPLSYRDTKQMIQDHYCRELKKAPFSRKSLDLVPEVGSCDQCPKRAGNDPDLTAEGVRADACTDPECYGRKCAAHAAQLKAAAVQAGQTVLEGPAADKLWDYHGTRLADFRYVDLGVECHMDTAKKPRSYAQLLKGHVEEADVVVAVDHAGQAHRLVDRAQAAKILQEQHKIKLHVDSGRNGSRGLSEQEKAERAKRAADNLLRGQVNREMLGQLAAGAERVFAVLPDTTPDAGMSDQVLRVLVQIGLQGSWVAEDICKERGLKAKHVGEQRDAIEKLASSLNGPGLMGLLVEVMAGRFFVNYDEMGHAKTLRAALKLPTRAEAEKTVKQRLKAEKAAKVNGKAKPDMTSSARGQKQAQKVAKLLGPKTLGNPTEQELRSSRAVIGVYFGTAGPGSGPLNLEAIEASYIGDKFEKKPKAPIKVRPFSWDAQTWVCIGNNGQYGHQSFEVVPLFTAKDFATVFPNRPLFLEPDYPDGTDRGQEADTRRRNAYWGVRIDVRGEEYVVGPRDRGKRITTVPPGEMEASGPGNRSDWRTCPVTDLDIDDAGLAILAQHQVATIGDLAEHLRDRSELAKTLGPKRYRSLLQQVRDAAADDVAVCTQCGSEALVDAAGRCCDCRPQTPEPVTFDTWIQDLITEAEPAEVEALEVAGLRTVRDVVNAAQQHPYGEGVQRVYSRLRDTPGVSADTANAIGDALVDAGLLQGIVWPKVDAKAARDAAADRLIADYDKPRGKQKAGKR